MNAPTRATAPPASHAPRISASECTCRATTEGLMKIPEPTMPPMTTRVASRRPSRGSNAGADVEVTAPSVASREGKLRSAWASAWGRRSGGVGDGLVGRLSLDAALGQRVLVGAQLVAPVLALVRPVELVVVHRHRVLVL